MKIINFSGALLMLSVLLAGCGPSNRNPPPATPQPTAFNTAQLTGQLKPWNFKNGRIRLFFNESERIVSTLSPEVSAAGSFNATLPVPVTDLLVPLVGSSCTFTGTQTVKDIQTATVVPLVLSTQNDLLGELAETSGGMPIIRQYADQAAAFKGILSCAGSEDISFDVQYTQGWNAVKVEEVNGIAHLTSLPQTAVSTFTMNQFEQTAGITFRDQSPLTLKAGEQTSRDVTIYQHGGLNGNISFETNVPGLRVRPASVSLEPLNKNLETQALATTLIFEADAEATDYSGELEVYAVKDGVRVGSGKLAFFTLLAPTISPYLPNNQELQVSQGESLNITFTVHSFEFSGSTPVTLTNLPTGITATTETVSLTAGESKEVTIRLTVAPEAALGTFTAQVAGPRLHQNTSGGYPVTFTVTSTRTLLTGDVNEAVPASQGIWVKGIGDPRRTTTTLQRIEPGSGKSVQSYLVPGEGHLLAAPGGNALLTTTVDAGEIYTYTATLYGPSGVISTVQTSDRADGPNYEEGAVDGRGHLWFMRSTDAQTGWTTATLAKLNLATGQTTEIKGGDFVGHEQLRASPSGTYIAIPHVHNNQALTLVETETGKLTGVAFPGHAFSFESSYAVTDTGDIFQGGHNALTRITKDGTLKSYPVPDPLHPVEVIGLDRVNSQLLWLTNGKHLLRFNTFNEEFVQTAPVPNTSHHSYLFGSPAGQGGIGYVTAEYYLNESGNYGGTQYVSFIK